MSVSVQNSQAIADGTYIVSSALANSKVLDIAGGSTADGGNLELYASNQTNAQKFTFELQPSGYYRIISVKSGKALDVASASTKAGANVQQWTPNSTDAQLWAAVANSDGTYSFVSRASGKYLDVAGASTANGTNIQQWDGNSTNAQRFRLTATRAAAQTLANGVYKISSALSSSLACDIAGGDILNGGNLQLWASNDTNAQRFRLTYLSDGYYRVESIQSGLSLDVDSGSQAPGTNVRQWQWNGTDAQKWLIVQNSDGTYTLVTGDQGCCLDVSGASTSNGANLQIWSANGTKAQRFNFSAATIKQDLPEGTYSIASSLNEDAVLDIAAGSTSNGGNAQIWSFNATNAQKFKVSYNGDGTYILTNVNSDKVLDVAGAGSANGTNVQQWESNSSNAQRWMIREAGNGQYYLISCCSGACLDISGASTENGTNVQTWSRNGTAAQKFMFDNARSVADGIYSIASAINGSKVLDVPGASTDSGTKLQIFTSNNSNAQLFEIKYRGGGYYWVISLNSGKMLDVRDGGTDDGTVVQQWDDNGNSAQLWKFYTMADGNIAIAPYFAPNSRLTVSNSSAADSTGIIISSSNGSRAQEFVLSSNKLVGEYQVMSDLQTISTSGTYADRFRGALSDINRNSPNSSGLVIDGDLTEWSSQYEYDCDKAMLADAGWSTDRVTAVMGNHEERTESGDYQACQNLFMGNFGLSSVYYSRNVAGHTFVVLGPDMTPQTSSWCALTLSTTQLSWLQDTLNSCKSNGTQADVYIHWPIEDTGYGTAYNFWSMQSGNTITNMWVLKDILNRYPNVTVYTGHSHMSANVWRENSSRPVYINTAAVAYLASGYDDDSNYDDSQGWYVYVLKDRVVYKARDYIGDTWIEGVQYTRWT